MSKNIKYFFQFILCVSVCVYEVSLLACPCFDVPLNAPYEQFSIGDC